MGTCKLVIEDEVNIKLEGLEVDIRRKLSNALKFEVPYARYMPQYKLGRWDGKVALCCNDWPGWYKCGDIHETTIADIWQGEAFHAARQKLYYGQRDFGRCNGGDNSTIRNGLLPDRMGKKSLPEPDDITDEQINQALSGGTYTTRVKKHYDFI